MHIKGVQMNPNARQNLYELSEPLEGHDFIVISYINNEFAEETYAFGADADGNIESWLELSVSRKGEWSDADLLEKADYRILTETN